MNSNPFAEGGPSKKHERGLPSRVVTLFKYVFFLPKSSTSDATVGKSSPLYSVNFAHFILFFNRSAKVRE
jgi:hypothetical protein